MDVFIFAGPAAQNAPQLSTGLFVDYEAKLHFAYVFRSIGTLRRTVIHFAMQRCVALSQSQVVEP